jgi:hypothetical protein
MLGVVIAFSLIIVALSGIGFVTPRGYVAFAERFAAGPGVWGGFAIRLALAIALWRAADSAATPAAFRVLAAIVALGATALPVMGQVRFERLVRWGSGQPPWILRSLCGLGIAFGLFLLWSSLVGQRTVT